jgi:hypothetical protein
MRTLRLSLTLPSTSSPRTLNRTLTSHNVIDGNACFAYFNKIRGIPSGCSVSLSSCSCEGDTLS